MAVDEQRIEQFLAQSAIRKEVAAVLRRASLEIVWVHQEGEGSRWALYLKLSPQLRQMFGTTREVLVWVVQSKEFQARSVSQAVKIIERERPRLCEDFCLVLTHDPNTRLAVDEVEELQSTTILGYSLNDLVANFAPVGNRDLLADLRSRLYSRDLYNLRAAVTSANDFYGRKVYARDVTNQLLKDRNHIGIFGLRKVGKTSLLNRVRNLVRGSNSACFAHVDVEKIDAINPSADYLLWSIGEAILDASKALRHEPDLLMFGRYAIFSRISESENIAELFAHDMKLLIRNSEIAIVIVLDEIERMSSDEWGQDFIRFWRLLRGIDQENGGKLSYFVTGTSPRAFEANTIAGKENPAFNYFNIRYLTGLDFAETSDLLMKIGRRMGIEWSQEALERIFRATGGHPALLRAFGSLAHKTRSNATFMREMHTSDVESLFSQFLLEESPLLSQLTAVLDEQYPDEAMLLQMLATGKIGEFRQYVAEFPNVASHLKGYGLCDELEHSSGLSNEILQTYLQQRTSAAERVDPQLLSDRPNAVGPYTVVATRGRPGGFARVYSGRHSSGEGDSVAIKVFDNGSILSLERELEPLQDVDHDAIVKVLDYGQTDTKVVYMVMELLEGKTLSEYCVRAMRPEAKTVVRWMLTLLSALKAIHPDVKKIEHLQRKPELSDDESKGCFRLGTDLFTVILSPKMLS